MQFRCPIPVPGREGEPDRGKRFSVRIARELLGGDIDCGKCQKHFNDDVFHRVLLSELLFPEFPVCWFAGAPFFCLSNTVSSGSIRNIAGRLQNGNVGKNAGKGGRKPEKDLRNRRGERAARPAGASEMARR